MAKNKTVTNILSVLVFIIVVVIIFFSACFVFKDQCGIDIISKISGPKPQPTIVAPVPPIQSALITTSYRGTLPCADCSGIDTELILKITDVGSTGGTYDTKETYLGKNIDPVITEGTWKTIFSSTKGKPIVIIVLNPDNQDNIRYLLKIDDSELKMFDKNKVELVGSPGVSLKKIIN